MTDVQVVSRPKPLRAALQATRSRVARTWNVSREDIVVSSVAWGVFMALLVTLAILQPDTFTFTEIAAYVGLSVPFAVLAVGQTVVLLSGGVDLSVGGALSVTNVLAAILITSDASIPLGTAGVLAGGALIGLVNGLIIVYGRMPPLIATLAMWFFWSGFALVIFPLPGGTIPAPMASLFNDTVAGIPMPYVMMVLLGVVGTWVLRTRLGLSIRAIGSDPNGASQSGIPVNRTLLCAYTISGLATGIGGWLLAAQNGAGDPGTGANYLLPVITAAVVGGTSLFGGRGGAWGGIAGGLILTYVAAVAFAANVPSDWGTVLDGLILILAVASQHFLREMFGKSRAR